MERYIPVAQTRPKPPHVWLLFLYAGYKRVVLGTTILSNGKGHFGPTRPVKVDHLGRRPPPGIGVFLPLSVLPFLALAKQAWEAHEPGDLGIQWPKDPEVEIRNKTKRSNNPVHRKGASLVHLVPPKPFKEYFISNVYKHDYLAQ